MELAEYKAERLCLRLGVCLFWALSAFGQQIFDEPPVPPNFNLDLEAAARLRPQFMSQSVAAVGRYPTGSLVFNRLIERLPSLFATKFAWELRIIDNGQFNAYSSPDGTIYVETGLAQLAGQSAGLWAAILSHEILHVMRRDWARRYLYQKSVESSSAAVIVLGDPGVPSASWTDSQKASENLGRFCRQLEVDADRDGLMLMAWAGYHPDFVPALHHLLHAEGTGAAPTSLYDMHPCWDERDRELMSAYIAARIEFDHRWPEWYASPGGNPPILVSVDAPTVRKTGSKGWEIHVPMSCQNLAGAVEVVLRVASAPGKGTRSGRFLALRSDFEMREVTGCTSPRTTVTFVVARSSEPSQPPANWAYVYVLDPLGSVLAGANVPKLPH